MRDLESGARECWPPVRNWWASFFIKLYMSFALFSFSFFSFAVVARKLGETFDANESIKVFFLVMYLCSRCINHHPGPCTSVVPKGDEIVGGSGAGQGQRKEFSVQSRDVWWEVFKRKFLSIVCTTNSPPFLHAKLSVKSTLLWCLVGSDLCFWDAFNCCGCLNLARVRVMSQRSQPHSGYISGSSSFCLFPLLLLFLEYWFYCIYMFIYKNIGGDYRPIPLLASLRTWGERVGPLLW